MKESKPMPEAKARELAKEIEDLCSRHGLWASILYEKKPDLKMIRIQEISIKVGR